MLSAPDNGIHRRRVFVLIHGTFATGAEWTQEGSAFCAALRRYDPQALIERYVWSGDNLQYVRESEATGLGDWILKHERLQACACRYVLIAHSHGGNFAASLGNRAELIGKLECVICLATPFVEYENPPNWDDTLAGIGALLASAGWVRAIQGCRWESIGSQAGLMLIPVAALCAGWFFCAARNQALESLHKRAHIGKRPPSEIPTLVLCHRWDEAYRVLSLLSIVTGAARLGKVLASIGLLAVVFAVREYGPSGCGQSVADVTSAFGFWTGLIFGLVGSVGVGVLLLLYLFFALLLESIWVPLIVLPLHLLRGSRAIAELANHLGLPRLTQSGFGESFLQTWAATTRVHQIPDGARHLKVSYVTYPRNGALLLHSGIYLAPAVHEQIFAFLDSGGRTEQPPIPDFREEDVWIGNGVDEVSLVGSAELQQDSDRGTSLVPLFESTTIVSPWEVAAVCGLLRSCGIEVTGGHCRDQIGGVTVLVRADQQAEARAIVNAQPKMTDA